MVTVKAIVQVVRQAISEQESQQRKQKATDASMMHLGLAVLSLCVGARVGVLVDDVFPRVLISNGAEFAAEVVRRIVVGLEGDDQQIATLYVEDVETLFIVHRQGLKEFHERNQTDGTKFVDITKAELPVMDQHPVVASHVDIILSHLAKDNTCLVKVEPGFVSEPNLMVAVAGYIIGYPFVYYFGKGNANFLSGTPLRMVSVQLTMKNGNQEMPVPYRITSFSIPEKHVSKSVDEQVIKPFLNKFIGTWQNRVKDLPLHAIEKTETVDHVAL